MFLQVTLGDNKERAPFLLAMTHAIRHTVNKEGGHDDTIQMVNNTAGSIIDNLVPVTGQREVYPGRIQLSTLYYKRRPSSEKRKLEELKVSKKQNKAKVAQVGGKVSERSLSPGEETSGVKKKTQPKRQKVGK